MPSSPRRINWAAAAAWVWPLIVIAPMFAHSGAPAFAHDWLWPLHPAQIQNFMTTGFQAWRRDGVGMPPTYPAAWWPYLLAGIACKFAGIHGGVMLYVYSALALGSWGVLTLARALGLSPAAQLAAVAIFAGNPFVLNELGAGHLIMLWAYAMLPWIVRFAYEPPTFARVFTIGVLVGLAAAQQQFFAFGLLAAACMILWRFPARLYTLLPMFAFAALVCMPEWIMAAFGAGTSVLHVLRPLPSWENAQSATLSESLRLLGYIGGYDRALPPAIAALLWLIPLAALAGALRCSRTSNAFASIAIAGVLFTTGVHGVLASLWSYGFSHWDAFAVFRELYDANALTAIGMSVLCSMAIDRMRRPSLVWGAVIVAALPITYVAANASRHLPWVSSESALASVIGRIAQNDGNARVLPLPLQPPLTYGGSRGGFSPLTIGVGAHPTAADAIASYAPAYLARSIETYGASHTARLAQRLDVGIVASLPQTQSAFVRIVEPRLKALAARFPGERPVDDVFAVFQTRRVAVVPFSAAPGTLASTYEGARDLTAVSGGKAIDLDAVGTDPSPASSWARAALWPVLPRWMFAEPSGVFTTRNTARLNVGPGLVIAGDAHGTIQSAQCRRVERLDEHFALLRCAARPVLAGRAPLAVAAAVEGGTPATRIPQMGKSGEAAVLQSGPARLVLHVRAAAGSALVLRDRFETGWSCSLTHARHVTVDGYANAWVLPSNVDGTVTLFYRPAFTFYVALTLSTALVACWLSAPVIVFARRFRRSSIEAMT